MWRHHLAFKVNEAIFLDSFGQLLAQISIGEVEFELEIPIVLGIYFYKVFSRLTVVVRIVGL